MRLRFTGKRAFQNPVAGVHVVVFGIRSGNAELTTPESRSWVLSGSVMPMQCLAASLALLL